MTLDFVAKRYGVLPSQLIAQGDTLDLDCANIAVAYEKFVVENPGVKTNHGKSQQELLQMMERARETQQPGKKTRT